MKKQLISITALAATILPLITISSPAKAVYGSKLQVSRGVNINNIDTTNPQETNPWKQRSFKIAKCNGYKTNKFDKKAKVASGGWTVSWAKDISETDVGLGVVAAGVSVYDGSASFQVWAQNLVRRTINSLGDDLSENVKAELTTILKKVVFDAIKGKSGKNIVKQFDTFDFKAGAIKYSGKNRFLCNTVSTTWGMKPYVAFRIRSSSKKLSQSSSTPSQFTSRNKWNDSIDIPIVKLNNPSSFDARFRAVNDWAGRNGYGGGYPNFHQADYGKGVVYGTIVLKKGAVEWKDIPASELGNPGNNEARFRAVNDWAGRNGYAAGFPNFHQADYGQGLVYGTILLKKGVAQVRDIPVSELGYPKTSEERFRAINDWAGRNGYAGGFPNFHQADYSQGVVYGAALIKK